MAKRTQEQQDREEAIAQIAFWMGASPRRQEVHDTPELEMGFIEMATRAIKAVDALEAIGGFDIFDEEVWPEKHGTWGNYVTTMDYIGNNLMEFMAEHKAEPTPAQMKALVKDSIDYF